MYCIFFLQKIDDATSLLTATCDTFIRTLEDIMKLTTVSGGNSYEMPVPNLVLNKNNSSSKSQICNKNHKQNLSRSISQENR